MARTRLIQLGTGIFIAGFILAIPAYLSNMTLRNEVTGQSSVDLVILPQVQNAGPITGDYVGVAVLQHVYNGVYSDTVTMSSTIELGYIDLAVHLEQSGNLVNGFVTLERTLVFTQEHSIMATPVAPPVGQGTPTLDPEPMAVGPLVQGTFDGASLRLLSESFNMNLNEQRVLTDGRVLPATNITRIFQLTTTSIQGDGATISGEYRETMWGYSPHPTTVIGTFTLQRPIFAISVTPKPTDPVVPDDTFYLPSIHNK